MHINVLYKYAFIVLFFFLSSCRETDSDTSSESVTPGNYINISKVAPTQSFSVAHSQIFSPNGQRFIIKGTNAFPDSSEHYESIVNCWGFNAVRINHLIDTAWYEIPEIDKMIETFTSNNIVVILDLAHDDATKDDQLAGIGHYWLHRKPELTKIYYNYASRYKNNPYVWFDLVNEPGAIDYDYLSWLNIHQTLIQTIRDAAENPHPILAQGWCWGQDACSWHSSPVLDAQSAFLTHGHALKAFNNKTYNNIIFSIHVYDQWGYSDRLVNYIDRVRNQGHSLIIGEYGYNTQDSKGALTSVNAMFDVLNQREIGSLVWTWFARDDGDLTTDSLAYGSGSGIDSCSTPTNLTELGRKIWNYNHYQ